MPKKPRFMISKVEGRARPWRLHIPAKFSDTGRQQRLFFATRREAEREKARLEMIQKTKGENILRQASVKALAEAEEARVILKPYAVSLIDAATFYARAHSHSVTWSQLATEYKQAKAAKRKRYREGISRTLRRFGEKLEGNPLVSAITPAIAKQTLQALDLKPVDWNNFRRHLSPVFNYAKAEGYTDHNPIADIRTMETPPRPICILSNAEVERLIDAAREHETLAYFALGIFAGIRPGELQRLRIEDVNLAKGHVAVSHAVSKTERKRFVEISVNLKKLLIAGYAFSESAVWPGRRAFEATRKQAGVNWGPDIMRHTYASNWLAYHEDLDRLALQLGHTTTKTSFEHYLHAIEKPDAIAFWQIGLPKQKPHLKEA